MWAVICFLPRHWIQQELATPCASFAIAVVQNGETLWEEAFGWANREKRVSATPHTMYSLRAGCYPLQIGEARLSAGVAEENGDIMKSSWKFVAAYVFLVLAVALLASGADYFVALDTPDAQPTAAASPLSRKAGR